MIHRRLNPPSRGVTLIEVLVAVSIIVILMAILLPAVMMARNAARKAQCLNNLRQIGIALNGYVSDHGVFPPASNGQGHSPLTLFLPYLDQKPLYDAVNLSVLTTGGRENGHATVWLTSISTFLCPSDPARVGHGATNYAGNRGVGFVSPYDDGQGLFNHPLAMLPQQKPIGPVTPAAVRDGLSNTAAFGEWLIGMNSASAGEINRSTYLTTAYPEAKDASRFLDECRSGRIQAIPHAIFGKGWTWMHGDLKSTLYNHVNPPNQRSCSNGGLIQLSAWTLGSLHGGGANVLAADGHVSFIKDGIAPQTWEALGTRAGGEAASLD